MSENKDKFQGDFRREVKKEEALNDFTSDLNEGKIIETSDETLESIRKTFNEEIDPLAKASETSITINSNPFDKTLEIMSQTLVSIDAKMDVENSQLQKLDQLSKIKNQLNRLENINIATEKLTLENEATIENEKKIEDEGAMPQNSIGHNQQEIVELLEKIQTLENKILIIESQSNNSNERFKKIESVVKRYEDLESEIPNLFKNLLKKKEETENYKKEIELETVKKAIPNDITNIIEDAEDSLENTSNELLISEDYKEELFKDDKKPKSNNLNYGLGILLFLCAVIVILFSFNEFQIINLNFDNVMSSIFSLFNNAMSNIYSLIDLILK